MGPTVAMEATMRVGILSRLRSLPVDWFSMHEEVGGAMLAEALRHSDVKTVQLDVLQLRELEHLTTPKPDVLVVAIDSDPHRFLAPKDEDATVSRCH